MTGRLAKLRDVIERELPRAMATMERLVSSLEQYAAIAETPSNAKKDASSSSEAADESPTDSNSENGSSADASL